MLRLPVVGGIRIELIMLESKITWIVVLIFVVVFLITGWQQRSINCINNQLKAVVNALIVQTDFNDNIINCLTCKVDTCPDSELAPVTNRSWEVKLSIRRY